MNPLKKLTSETNLTVAEYDAPTHLKHRPIFMLPYEPFDGPEPKDTDAKYISIGLAQWRDADVDDPYSISAKVWRYSDESKKWSRMSEELPLHRVVDLCIFIVTTLFKEKPAFPPNTFENQSEELELKLLEALPEGLNKTKNVLRNRLTVLHHVMTNAGIGWRNLNGAAQTEYKDFPGHL